MCIKLASNVIPFNLYIKLASNVIPFNIYIKLASNAIPFSMCIKLASNTIPFSMCIKLASNAIPFNMCITLTSIIILLLLDHRVYRMNMCILLSDRQTLEYIHVYAKCDDESYGQEKWVGIKPCCCTVPPRVNENLETNLAFLYVMKTSITLIL